MSISKHVRSRRPSDESVVALGDAVKFLKVETIITKFIKQFNSKEWAESKDFLRGLQAKAYHNDDEYLLEKILKNNCNKEKIMISH